MNNNTSIPKPVGAIWRPVRDLDPAHRQLQHAGARQAAKKWKKMRSRLEDKTIDKSSMELWIKLQNRAFAIKTGQIEGLYLLKRGITETLIAEGFEGVRGTHSVIDVSDQTLKGLLEDQESALEMMFAHVKDKRPLTGSAIKEWHALLTRHQASATGITPFGKRIEIPLRKGQYKIRPNNPRRRDGFVHEYCPPEQVEQEMEAAWLHHEFVRIHPFQDGNGRISRMLMAYAYAKAWEFPPIIPAQNKAAYIANLELADEGDFPALVNYLGDLSMIRTNEASARAELIVRGRNHYVHGNGGITHNGVYHPPEEFLPEVEEEPDPDEEPESSPPAPGM